jgi:hypothetical protein
MNLLVECNLIVKSGKAVPYAHHEADKKDKVNYSSFLT